MKSLVQVAFIAALLCFPVSAFAKAPSPSCSEGPWIALSWGDDWSAEQRRAVLEHLRRGFEVYGVAVCEREAAPARQPLAEVRFAATDADSVSLSVDVKDRVTQKRVGRDVDVRGYSREAQALAIAIATEELVRASWVELELESPREQQTAAPRASTPAPDVVHRVNQDSIGTAAAGLRIDVRGAFEFYAGGQTHLGGDLTLRQNLTGDLGLGFALGPRLALRDTSRLGSVDAKLMAGETFLFLDLLHGEMLRLGWEVGVRGGLVRFESDPTSGAEVTRSAGLLVAKTSIGLDLALDTTWYLALNAGVGHTLVGATATGRGRELTGVSGLELHSSLGLGGRW
ncbi:MAG: hypothetical protein H6718_00745 [Polyangiaceae bacterium]|nr:hypothetical protein [Myxococcales bacterium]MCB9583891.1 hypothetical protein [Polyangiaceae bacterium]MCB9607853.1 hypothetical protein [Polyangiaceae bacterium]